MPLVILPIPAPQESRWTPITGHNKTSGQMQIAREIFPILIKGETGRPLNFKETSRSLYVQPNKMFFSSFFASVDIHFYYSYMYS